MPLIYSFSSVSLGALTGVVPPFLKYAFVVAEDQVDTSLGRRALRRTVTDRSLAVAPVSVLLLQVTGAFRLLLPKGFGGICGDGGCLGRLLRS